MRTGPMLLKFFTALVFATTILAGQIAFAADAPASNPEADAPRSPDYNTQIAPLFRKYCNGCHNADDAEGGLALDDFSKLMRGGKKGVDVVAGKSEDSRLVLVLEKKSEPFMPPEGSEGPTPDEIALLKAWIDAGAKGPDGQGPDPYVIVTPDIKPVGPVRDPINAAAWSRDGKWIAVARYRHVEILDGHSRKPVQKLGGHAGNVNDVSFSADGKTLVVAAGEAGLFGEATLWNTADWKPLRTIRGHRDSLYSASLSPDGKTLATAGYDQKIILWDAATGSELKTLSGHNGPVFDLAFHPSGKILASASGDRTVKLWDVAKGERLDTLIEPEKEQYAVAFSPDGRFVVAGGVDNRIRLWEVRQMGKEGTSPIQFSRFAHDEPIIDLVFSPDGKVLLSASEDRSIKVWETKSLAQLRKIGDQSDWVEALAFAPDNKTLVVGRLDGTLGTYDIDTAASGRQTAEPLTRLPVPQSHAGSLPLDKLPKVAEAEPNDAIAQATPLPVPGIADGVLQPAPGNSQDVDLYRFSAKRGETWMIETNASRQNSPADTNIEVLHADGRPVERLLLRAVRDSYIEFRPIDSTQDQVRVKNWEEMQLNQYLYMAGEVGKFFRMPQGPDSGMGMYKTNGKRKAYFDTTATIHALEDPIYIVEPYPPGVELVDNGLPVFPLNYGNDDDGERKLGTDSQLRFTAPADGEYLVKVTDVRGFSGADYKYSLIVRGPSPGFTAKITGTGATVAAGSGQRITVQLDRIDGFDGDVRVEIGSLPAGFSVSTPIVVEAGHLEAHGVLNAAADAQAPPKEAWNGVKVVAAAFINGQQVQHDLGNLGEIKLAEKPKFIVHLEQDRTITVGRTSSPSTTPPSPPGRGAGGEGNSPSGSAPIELVIAPGTTIAALVRIERAEGFKNELRFDVDNLPHGVIVDNIGLSGIMVREGETERQIFITAADWVPETTRQVFAVSQQEGKQASRPVVFHVRKPDAVATAPGGGGGEENEK